MGEYGGTAFGGYDGTHSGLWTYRCGTNGGRWYTQGGGPAHTDVTRYCLHPLDGWKRREIGISGCSPLSATRGAEKRGTDGVRFGPVGMAEMSRASSGGHVGGRSLSAPRRRVADGAKEAERPGPYPRVLCPSYGVPGTELACCATPCPAQTFGIGYGMSGTNVWYWLRHVRYKRVVLAAPCPVLTFSTGYGRPLSLALAALRLPRPLPAQPPSPRELHAQVWPPSPRDRRPYCT